uniref:Uncharacterized protein n=1 Tax=Triticum urartu TaxID=4572 RepID=A0A8R7QQI2_TRIUA
MMKVQMSSIFNGYPPSASKMPILFSPWRSEDDSVDTYKIVFCVAMLSVQSVVKMQPWVCR